MINLIRYRSKAMIKKNVFKNENEIDQHINFIEREKTGLSDKLRTLELKNWLDYIKN